MTITVDAIMSRSVAVEADMVDAEADADAEGEGEDLITTIILSSLHSFLHCCLATTTMD